MKVEVLHSEFEDFAKDFIENDGGQYPTFIFIDPFGFSGLPFETVKNLINLRPSGIELSISFMSGKMAQYMESPTHQKAISNILGMDDWVDHIAPDLSKEERAEQFLRLYEERLRNDADVKYVWPFQMIEEGKRQTSYYLVHATNHFDGFKIMKDIMFNAGAEDRFAYLGRDHYPYLQEQHSLDAFNDDADIDERVENLAVSLRGRYAGKPTRTLWDLMEETYEETTLIEKHYRAAGKIMRDRGLAEITNHPEKHHGRNSPGFGKDDEIEFFAGNFADFAD